MLYKALSIAAVLTLGTISPVAAQSAAPPAGSPASDGVVAMVDVSRLPIDLGRIERNFRRSTTIREERDGLNLRYFVEVFALSPKIVLFSPEDNLEYGKAPYGGPTHSEMIEMMTPREFRKHGGANILSPKSSTKKK